jgi:hypothetical protein
MMMKNMKICVVVALQAILLGYLTSCSKEDIETGIDIIGQVPIQDGDYYVATWGNDTNSGTFDSPWATWQKAFETAEAGDIVYFRGGVYRPTSAAHGNDITMINTRDGIGHSGTEGNPICYLNYPGETPILDCSLIYPEGNFNTALQIIAASFIKFKGLTIRNVYQYVYPKQAFGIVAEEGSSNLTLENITVHDIGGNAIRIYVPVGYFGIEYDSTKLINCDAYNCCDTFSISPGNAADGIKVWGEKGGYLTFYGCRAWNCSDDGFDLAGSAVRDVRNCWSFANGLGEYTLEGNGMKFGAISDSTPTPQVYIINCIAAYNRYIGFYDLDYDPYYRNNSRIYNNTSYKNAYGFGGCLNNPSKPYSFTVYRNNIEYDSHPQGEYPTNQIFPHMSGFLGYDLANCTWKWQDSWPYNVPSTDITVSDEDFVSLDGSQLFKSRKPDGSLPDIDFLKLKPESDLIDAGVDVGIAYEGNSPDIGAHEYSGIIVSSAGGSITITKDGGSIQLSAKVLSDYDTSKTITWSIINGTGQATISTEGMVTAVDNGTVRAKASINDGSGISGSLVIIISSFRRRRC